MLSSRLAATHLNASNLGTMSLPIKISFGRAANWATAVQKDVGGSASPLSVRLPSLIHIAMSHRAPVERREVGRAVWRGLYYGREGFYVRGPDSRRKSCPKLCTVTTREHPKARYARCAKKARAHRIGTKKGVFTIPVHDF